MVDRHQKSMKTRIKNLSVILMITMFVIIGSIIFYNWKLSADKTIHRLQEDANRNIAGSIERYMDAPMRINKINQQIISNKIVDICNEKQREKYFSGIIKTTEETVYSVSYGSEQGQYYGTRRNADNQLEVMKSDEKTGGRPRYYSMMPDLTAGEMVMQLDTFDPRTRGWYQVAKNTGGPAFSPIYKHFVMNDLAISASCPIYNQQGVLQGVLGTHITLSQINAQLQELVKDKHVNAYIVERHSGELVANSLAFPNFSMTEDGKINRMIIGEMPDQSIADAYENYKKTDRADFIFANKNEKEHIKISRFTKEGIDWLIITSMPESPYVEEIKRSILLAILLSIVTLGSAIFIWNKTIETYLKPIYELIRTTERYSQGDFSQRAQLGNDDEIGKLAKAFNEMAEEICLLIDGLEKKVSERTRELEQTNYELSIAKEKLELSSQMDFLTNLYNRKFIIGRIEHEIKRFDRTENMFAIIMGDIDHFKKLNDTYGHECGDFVLKEIAKVMQKTTREIDFVARWGGEEFLILLPESDRESAAEIAERLRKSIEHTTIEYDKKRLNATITFGVAAYGKGMTADEVIKNADRALYDGKQQGRNRVSSSVI
ncbi:MAG: hypothetical protein H6Q66_1428 [Firmicutes bacterium]|nr:hypothetical protein [Bacillota bacterium]